VVPGLGETPLNISFFLAIAALVIYGVVVSRSRGASSCAPPA
jgi:simple sugar transport system permease protein